MPSLDQVIEEVLLLTQNSPFILLATTSDQIYKTFSEEPYLPHEYAEEGMWYAANCKLDKVFGVRDLSMNIRKGPHGLPMAVNWLNKARKHELWDSEADKARRLVKNAGWDSDSDRLVKVRMENILSHVKGIFFSFSLSCFLYTYVFLSNIN